LYHDAPIHERQVYKSGVGETFYWGRKTEKHELQQKDYLLTSETILLILLERM
jgi:hypothetical protein